jgi:gamma-glutamylcyclotransferase (GGCT)/AIG2-like uncharacterized protein YtfP
MRLFIYGSLMRGEPAHHLLGSARPLGPARTAPGHRLVSHAGFPGLVADGPGLGVVVGELYFVNDSKILTILDDYEDVFVLYARRPVMLDDGTDAIAWWLNPPASLTAASLPMASGHPVIADWRLRKRA